MPPRLITQYPHRQPSIWLDGSGNPSPYLYDRPGTIPVQANVDREIAAAKNAGIKFFAYDLYGFADYMAPADMAAQPSVRDYVSTIVKPFLAHTTSAHKSDVQFAFILVSQWFCNITKGGVLWGYQQEFAQEARTWIDDPNYFRSRGKPVVFVNGTAQVCPDGDSFATHLLTTTAAGPSIKSVLGNVWIVNVDVDAATVALNADARICYGPAGCTLSGVAGRYSWAFQLNQDLGRTLGNVNRLRVTQLTPMAQDQRPNRADTASFPWTSYAYGDLATQPEQYAELQQLMAGADFGLVYAWDELHEGGAGIMPTVQEGTRFLDPIGWYTGATIKPPTSTYRIGTSSVGHVVRAGAWVQSPPGAIPGNYDGEETTSNTTNDTLTFTEVGVRFKLSGTTSNDRGIASIKLDGATVATPDLYTASTVRGFVYWDSGAIANGSHTIELKVTGTKNASSSGVTIGADALHHTFIP